MIRLSGPPSALSSMSVFAPWICFISNLCAERERVRYALTSLSFSMRVDLASSLRMPTSSPLSTGTGTVDSDSPEVEGAGGGCPLCNLDGPAVAMVRRYFVDVYAMQ